MGRIVDVTVVLQHQVPTSQTVRKTVEVSTVPAEVVDVMTRVTRHRLSHYCEHQSHLVQQRLEWHWTLGHFHVTVFLGKFQVEPKARLRTRSCPDGQVAYEADSTAPRLTSQTDRKTYFLYVWPTFFVLAWSSSQWCQIKTDPRTGTLWRCSDGFRPVTRKVDYPNVFALAGFERRCSVLFAPRHRKRTLTSLLHTVWCAAVPWGENTGMRTFLLLPPTIPCRSRRLKQNFVMPC